MHELSLIADLMRKIAFIAREEGAAKVTCVKVKVGVFCHLSVAHLREHFVHAARGTVAEGARLDIEVLTDMTDPRAQEILLDSVEVEKGL
jgi:hydrogenase nickel incorporation protein HypA/HybF